MWETTLQYDPRAAEILTPGKKVPGIYSVQFSRSIVSDSLRPHGWWHVRLPVHDEHPELAQIHAHRISDTIEPSHPLSSPSPPAFHLSQHQGLFQWVSSLHQVVNIGVAVSASVLLMYIQDWFPLGWTGWISLQSKGLSRVFSNTTVQKHQILQHSAFFTVQLSQSYMTTGKTIALTRQTFVGKGVSLLFNMLSRLVITFLPRSKCLLIFMAASAVILEPPKIKSATVSTISPSICHDVMGPDAMILVFWMLSLKPTFSLSSFTFIKRLFSSSLSAIRVLSSACLRLLIFLLTILIPAYVSSSLAFCMMYSAYELNKAGWQYTALMYSFAYLESVCCSMSSSNCCFLICIQISQEAGQVVWYSHLLKNFPQFVVIHTVKDFVLVNKAEVDVFLNTFTFSKIQHQILSNWSLVPLPFLKPAWTCRNSQFKNYWSLVWRILSITF